MTLHIDASGVVDCISDLEKWQYDEGSQRGKIEQTPKAASTLWSGTNTTAQLPSYVCFVLRHFPKIYEDSDGSRRAEAKGPA